MNSYGYGIQNILWQFDKTGARASTFVGDRSIDNHLMVIQGSKAHFYHTDHLNSVTAITDDLGETEEKIVYSSFGKIMSRKDKNGNELASNQGVQQPFYFTGREWDGDELGTYHYRAREYSPQTGKFLQLDPAGINAGLNLVRYVLGNPLRLSDPTGMIIADETGGKTPAEVKDSRIFRELDASPIPIYIVENPNLTGSYGEATYVPKYEFYVIEINPNLSSNSTTAIDTYTHELNHIVGHQGTPASREFQDTEGILPGVLKENYGAGGVHGGICPSR